MAGRGALTYDTKFDLSGYDGWVYGYDAEKRLISANSLGGNSAQFVYDGVGRSVKRTIDGATTVFTYDGWKPVAEWKWTNGASALVAWNLYGPGADEILVRYQVSPAGYLYYHLDANGNVQFLLSEALLGLEKYTYDVFGKPTIRGWNGSEGDVRAISSYGNRFLFTGREYLYTLGLYDYRHRIYNPELGRFMQTDPLGQQVEGTKLSTEQAALYAETAPETFNSSELNLYRYCHNDPVNNVDPMGLKFIPSETEVDSIVEAPSRFGRTNSDMAFQIDASGKGNSWKVVLQSLTFMPKAGSRKLTTATGGRKRESLQLKHTKSCIGTNMRSFTIKISSFQTKYTAPPRRRTPQEN